NNILIRRAATANKVMGCALGCFICLNVSSLQLVTIRCNATKPLILPYLHQNEPLLSGLPCTRTNPSFLVFLAPDRIPSFCSSLHQHEPLLSDHPCTRMNPSFLVFLAPERTSPFVDPLDCITSSYIISSS